MSSSPTIQPESQTQVAQRRLEALTSTLTTPMSLDHQNKASPSQSQTTTIPAITTIAGPSTNPRTKDKVVIITGANSITGIGRASAHQFAQNGARAIYVCDAMDTYLAIHKREIETAHPGCSVHAVTLDVGDEAAVQGVVDDAVSRYGRLDVMFANAGVSGGTRAFDDVGADEYMDIMRVNALGVFLCFKTAAVAMKRSIKAGAQVGGSLIGTASVAGLRSNAGGTAYSASKAAVVSMAQTMAYQLVGTGVRCNAICPGLIETGMTAPVFDTARSRGTLGKVGQLNPTRRGGVADEIARVALFLGSDEASYVNGQAWAVCGGLSAGHPFVPGKLA